MSGSRFSLLFADAKERNRRQKSVSGIISDTECTFHPNIQITKRKVSKNRNKICKSRCQYVTRSFIGISSEPKATFIPKVGRGPKLPRSNIPIWEHLNAKETHTNQNSQRKNEFQENNKLDFVSKKSGRIVAEMKRRCFCKIFNLLTSDKNGVINSYKITSKCI